MKSRFIYIVAGISFLILLLGCKTNRNTFIHRGYHNLTARFNGYYYATESIKEGEDKIASNYKYDYDRLLPVFLIANNESAKSTFPEFDKAIKKSSNCIQRHTIKDKKSGDEITNAGRWIDNNWNVIGISHFYKREFFSGIEAFEYVIRSYKSKDKYKAMIWLVRSYNEIGSPTQADPIIGLLKEDKKISKYAAKELPAVQADYFIKRGMYPEAEVALLSALKGGDVVGKRGVANLWFLAKSRPSKKTRARYAFILGQLYEERGENKKAIQFYQKTISLKPDYEFVFNAKIKQTRLLDVNSGNVSKLKRELLKMTRDIKNTEYLDVIYYTLGEIFEKEKNETEAIINYKLSIKSSTQNPKQKALSYLKLGEINFENANYTAAGGYYDSTMITLPKDYKDYTIIAKRKETLETLIGYIKTIQKEDSLQRIAKMNESDRNSFIKKLIQKHEENEEKKIQEAEALKMQNENPNYNPSGVPMSGLPNAGSGAKGDWYFYNQTTLSFGLNDFIKKWGNRKLEDNWRRSQKALVFENQVNEANDTTDKVDDKNKLTNKTDKKWMNYLSDLPLSDSLMNSSNKRIMDALYNLGSTYKEELNNYEKAIAAFEELNHRFSENKYKLSIYFQLYRIYGSINNQSKSDFYKNKLLNEYPNSEYAQIIKNPKYMADKNAQKGEVELFYTNTYESYASANFKEAYDNCQQADYKFGKNDFAPKFAFIKAMCIGKLRGADSLESALKRLQVSYPKDPVSKQAQDILEVIYQMKHSDKSGQINKTDTFSLDLNSPHIVVAVCPDEASMVNVFKSALADYNNVYYSNTNLSISNSLFGTSNQITNVKTFNNAKEALEYIENLKKDKTVFNDKVKMDRFSIMTISVDNFPKFYKKKDVGYYKPFYNDHYKLQK